MKNRYPFLIIIGSLLLIGGYVLINNQTSRQTDSQHNPPTQKESNDPVTQSIDPTNTQTSCSGKAIPDLAEGPYYKANTPERTNLAEQGIAGEKITVTGYIFDTNCQPVAHAWLDFWQADGNGVYDNSGYKLRGHQYTDAAGRYTLTTVIPGRYPGRTPHIHFKVRAAESSKTVTSQLFFPGEPQNHTDTIFDTSLIMDVSGEDEGKVGTFNIVVST